MLFACRFVFCMYTILYTYKTYKDTILYLPLNLEDYNIGAPEDTKAYICSTGTEPAQTSWFEKIVVYYIPQKMQNSPQQNRNQNHRCSNNHGIAGAPGCQRCAVLTQAVSDLNKERDDLKEQLAAMTVHAQALERCLRTSNAQNNKLQDEIQAKIADDNRDKTMRNEASEEIATQLYNNDQLELALNKSRRDYAKMKKEFEAFRRQVSAGPTIEKTPAKASLTEDEVREHAALIVFHNNVNGNKPPKDALAFYFRNQGYAGNINETDEARLIRAMNELTIPAMNYHRQRTATEVNLLARLIIDQCAFRQNPHSEHTVNEVFRLMHETHPSYRFLPEDKQRILRAVAGMIPANRQ